MIFLVFLQWPASRVTSSRNGSVKSFDFSRSNSSSEPLLSVSGQHRQLDAGLIIPVVSGDAALFFCQEGRNHFMRLVLRIHLRSTMEKKDQA